MDWVLWVLERFHIHFWHQEFIFGHGKRGIIDGKGESRSGRRWGMASKQKSSRGVWIHVEYAELGDMSFSPSRHNDTIFMTNRILSVF